MIWKVPLVLSFHLGFADNVWASVNLLHIDINILLQFWQSCNPYIWSGDFGAAKTFICSVALLI